MEREDVLIVGLGNPGKKYEDTRHNIGFRVVRALADKYSLSFKPALIRAKGSLAEGKIAEVHTWILLPLTYMNESGLSVKKCMSYYKISLAHILVVTDDIALDFGRLRLRDRGSSGGHNGMKSVQAHLGSHYARLRIGVGDRVKGELSDYVLGRFNEEEQRALPAVVIRAIETIELWIVEGEKKTMQEANRSNRDA